MPRHKHSSRARELTRVTGKVAAFAAIAASVLVFGLHFDHSGSRSDEAVKLMSQAKPDPVALIPTAKLETARASARDSVAEQARASRAQRAKLESLRPKWVLPIQSAISSPYGPRWGGFHPGVDFVAAYGTPVHAAGDGYVVAPNDGTDGYGMVVCIAHPDGSRTWYAHLSKTLVHIGQHVDAGDVIALSGASGEVTGPHLHFEVRYGTQTVDPVPWFRKHGVSVWY